MKRSLAAAIVVVMSVLSSLSIASADDTPVLDQVSDGITNEYSGFGDNVEERLGQSITPAISGYLKQVDIFIGKSNDDLTGNVNVDFMPLSSRDIPLDGDQWTSEHIDASLITQNGSWISVTLSEPVYLRAGKPFVVRLVGDNGDQDRFQSYRWYTRVSSAPDYTRGHAFRFNFDTDRWDTDHGDYGIKTYVLPFDMPEETIALKPKVSVYFDAKKNAFKSIDVSAVSKVAKVLPNGSTLVCTGYSYRSSAAARAYALKLAKKACSLAKSKVSRLSTLSETKSSTSAPRAARGSVWTAGSYRIDLSYRSTVN